MSAQAFADWIFEGPIYTADPYQPWVEALAVRDGSILEVGAVNTICDHKGPNTNAVELGNRLVLPGFHDAHVHPIPAGLKRLGCLLDEGQNLEDYQQLIVEYAKREPDAEWIIGDGWAQTAFLAEFEPNRKQLDAVVSDRPAAMLSRDGHSLWLNTKAVELVDLSSVASNPAMEAFVVKASDGSPSGLVHETAVGAVLKHKPPASPEQRTDALRFGVRQLHRWGVIGWQDAYVSLRPDEPDYGVGVYEAVLADGQVLGHVSLALAWNPSAGPEQVSDLVAAASQAAKLGLRARTVKFFLDGEFYGRSAALIEPYADQQDHRGSLLIDPAVFEDAATSLDGAGIQIHAHAIGDAAIRTALDGLSAARKANGRTDNRHIIAHTNLVTPRDRDRFAELGVNGVFQPLWARMEPYMQMCVSRVGSTRVAQMYPIASLIRNGVHVAFGSDWPVTTADPLHGIEVAVTRRNPGAIEGEPLTPDEGITLAQAVDAYTIGAAHTNHMDSVSGSLEVGKSADLVVLDRNIFEIPIHEVSETTTVFSMLGGMPLADDIETMQHG